MSDYVIFSDKYHNLPDEKISGMCQYPLKNFKFEDRSAGDQRVWSFSNGKSEVQLTEMRNSEVDACADREIEALAALETDATRKRLAQLRNGLLKATTVITATPSGEDNKDFFEDVVGTFVYTLRAVVKHEGAFYDQEPRLIINQDGEMNPKAKADPYDETSEVPLPFTFASLGKLERLKVAIADDPTLMTKVDKVGRTILHVAVQGGCCEVVRFLLENGADPNARTKKLSEPLFQAYSADVIPLLHEFGADPSVVDKGGNTPLHRAAAQGYEDVVPALLKIGADPSAANKDGKKPVDLVDADFYPELVALLT